MKTFSFKGILTNTGWLEEAFVTVDDYGKIVSISQTHEHQFERLNCYALPGFQNAHSHAFQYAMAGLAETHSIDKTPDDFWSWRDSMYKLALRISPDDLQKIAQQLYAEMLRHGYTNVAEFHYVHHDQQGNKYGNISEMGERLVAAASAVGIGITLIPIFYQKGGFGKDPVEGQKRFISNSIEEYEQLLAATEKSCQLYEHANIGIGMHSMRAVEPAVISEVARDGRADIPFHIHISEQLKEVEESLHFLGKRPVEWMLENVELSDRFHFVHATHLTEDETKRLAESGVNVVLCPSTEGNLGDGLFPLKVYQHFGGKWNIGTDSHVGLNPFEELRILDYGQRLLSHKRNTFYSKNQGDSGQYAIDMITKTGRKAMGNEEQEYFQIGAYFDAVLISAETALMGSTSLDNLTSTIVYSSDVSMQYGTISKGRLLVQGGQHEKADQIRDEFVQTIRQLKSR